MWNLIITAILNYVSLWLDSAHKQALQWENRVLKGKLSSAVNTHEIEKRISTARPLHKTLTPAAWNRKVPSPSAGLLLLFVILIPCCTPVFIESRWPVIDIPSRPALPEIPETFTQRELILVDYAEILELTIMIFNEAAQEHNTEHGYIE